MTDGGVSSGYRAIGSSGMQIAPARMMISEQTVARIGRRMKTSEDKGYPPSPAGAAFGLGLGFASAARIVTGEPSPIFCTPDTISLSPGFRPDLTT